MAYIYNIHYNQIYIIYNIHTHNIYIYVYTVYIYMHQHGVALHPSLARGPAVGRPETIRIREVSGTRRQRLVFFFEHFPQSAEGKVSRCFFWMFS